MFRNSRFFILVVVTTIFIFSDIGGLFSLDNFRLSGVNVKDNVNNEQKYEKYGRKKGGRNSNRVTRRTVKKNKKGKPVYKYD